MKSEPSDFSIDDLRRKKGEPWTGVRNFQARNYMREMVVGDLVVFYHSSCDAIGAAGIAKVVSPAHHDPTQFNKMSKYFDPRSTKAKPLWWCVRVGFVKKFPHVIARNKLRGNKMLHGIKLWSHPRLSIIPLAKKEFDSIVHDV